MRPEDAKAKRDKQRLGLASRSMTGVTGGRARLERNRAQLAALQAELRTLQSTVNALQTDPRAVERAARERGMAKPGETIIRFEPAPR